jgi:hypothetical protein
MPQATITSVATDHETLHMVVRPWHDPCQAMAEKTSKASSRRKTRSRQNHQKELQMEAVIHMIDQLHVAGCLGRQSLLWRLINRLFTIVW